jgi:DNA transposition AAA+ family ATPase
MALTAKRKAELARMTLPSEDSLRERIRLFQARAGINNNDFAQLIGYSHSAVSLFMLGLYGSNHPKAQNSLALRAAAKQYMDLHDVDNNIALRGRHYKTASSIEVREAALNALQKGTAYLVDGPPGTEKSWSLLQVQREINESGLGRAIYVYARVNHSPQSFLAECCAAAGIVNSRGTPIDMMLRKLRFFLGKGRTLLEIDEGQHLDHAGLEVLRQLLDLPPYFGVIIGGSHDLTQRLSHWQMEQWRSRLRKTLYLNGPTAAEARMILRSELGEMTDADCDETIASCKARAQRIELVDGKQVNRTFSYISARDLFGAIERVKERFAPASIHAQGQKAGAA